MVQTRPAPSGPPPRNPPPQDVRDHRGPDRHDHDHDGGGPPPGPRPERHIFLEGRVTNAATGEPIGRASIDYTGPAIGTATSDADGYFKTPELPPGEYNVRVRREHFETMIKAAHVIDGPQRVDIAMKAK